MSRRVLVTGATGLLGSHLVERLGARGDHVLALARQSSATGFLDERGVEVVRGDLTDPSACDRALDGINVVYHCAAKVGDWGSWCEFQVGCIDATRTLAEAAVRARVDRFVHVSSTSAYGHPSDRAEPIAETHPLGDNIWVLDYYTRSKVDCERLLWGLAETGGLPLTVIRPSWIFGERDRTTMPRLIQEFRWNRVSIVGKGDNPLSAVYAGVVADAAILAADDPGSVGEAYNVTSQAAITQRQFLDMLADALDVPRVTWRYPFLYAFYGGFALELRERLRRSKKPPQVTRYGAWLLGRRLSYSTEKARNKLGWTPALSYEESIERTVQWFLADQDARIPKRRTPPVVAVRRALGLLRTEPEAAPRSREPAFDRPAAESARVPRRPESGRGSR
ncbi:NAD-dependent epimerase/dehydratase family protein [Paludisphaera borealis]|uniref:3 beta-hydroxysteroid dehydrogenase/Delta 5-->4-isomerase n=1 Tax=Paludisphaera borealis TaxID=1387353 RepID=A0A1U7CKA1_9BACT|nr:NAD-dependent epimerase/dehydratase family protein [Paludisphaera borealis]APW59362.1 3 beta-hydroxysteroid dehydrogenase/Delta 5-->4-isomerase [Paludisphaera borealis]